MADEDRDKEEEKKEDRPANPYRWMSAGLEFCGVIGLFSFLGYLLDEHFQSHPLYMLTGFFIGFLGMLYIYYKDSTR